MAAMFLFCAAISCCFFTTIERSRRITVPHHCYTVTLNHSSHRIELSHDTVGLDITATVLSPSLYTAHRCALLIWSGSPFRTHPPRSTRRRLIVLLLLLTAGVEPNPGPPRSLTLGLFNTGGANKKAAQIADLIRDHDLDLLAISETKMNAETPDAIKNDLAPPGYNILHVHPPRKSNIPMHGLALIYSSKLSVRPRKKLPHPTSFELQAVNIKAGSGHIVVANIYRSPSQINPKSIFVSELEDFISTVGVEAGDRLVLCGDFNMPGTRSTAIDPDLSALFDVHTLRQHVNAPTRRDNRTGRDRENILDLIVTTSTSTTVTDVKVESSFHLSDHSLVKCKLSVERVKLPPTSYQYRDIKSLDKSVFQQRLLESTLLADIDIPVDDYLTDVERVVRGALDELAPVRTATRPGGRGSARWLTQEAVDAKQTRRRLERRWKSSQSSANCQTAESNRLRYRAACRRANRLINESRNQHRCKRVTDVVGNPRRMWSEVKNLLHRAAPAVQKSTAECQSFSEQLADFFINKVRDIKLRIAVVFGDDLPDPMKHDPSQVGPDLSRINFVTPEEVETLLGSMSGKSSPLDFVPTSLLKDCSGVFARIIARLANLSFEQGTFPKVFKTAQITPLVKKPGLDDDDPASYRPISNLNTISKVLERLFLARILPHVSSSPNFNPVQSAYRKYHSTETALLKILEDIYGAMDKGRATVLVALDMSAAFDTIDHDVLLRRLRNTFGIAGACLDWLASYLNQRESFVRYGSGRSLTSRCTVGVPQGSSLGPLLFTLFIAPLAQVTDSFGVHHHQYADDTQLYIFVNKRDPSVDIPVLERCTDAIYDWLSHNGLALNPAKSEAIRISVGPPLSNAVSVDTISVAGAPIKLVDSIKSLGVIIDKGLTFNQHVAMICKGCYFHIRSLRHIRASLPDDVAKTVACSIVSSRLDYCNSLLVGMSESNFDKLQRVQNTLARAVTGKRKYDHITPVLTELHWLPIRSRVSYKIATLAYKMRQTGAPAYLASSIPSYVPVRSLRSSSRCLVSTSVTKNVTPTRAFSHSAAEIWNSLPLDCKHCSSIETFKKHLKTHLFNAAYKS